MYRKIKIKIFRPDDLAREFCVGLKVLALCNGYRRSRFLLFNE